MDSERRESRLRRRVLERALQMNRREIAVEGFDDPSVEVRSQQHLRAAAIRYQRESLIHRAHLRIVHRPDTHRVRRKPAGDSAVFSRLDELAAHPFYFESRTGVCHHTRRRSGYMSHTPRVHKIGASDIRRSLALGTKNRFLETVCLALRIGHKY